MLTIVRTMGRSEDWAGNAASITVSAMGSRSRPFMRNASCRLPLSVGEGFCAEQVGILAFSGVAQSPVH